MALLDALRALSAFTPPPSLPDCDLGLLGDVLEAHGLAPLASHHLESSRLGMAVPESFRERLLSSYQGVMTDNLLKVVSLRRALRDADVPVVLLDAAAYLEWLYPHLGFRPVVELRAALRAEDAPRLVERLAGRFEPAPTGPDARTLSLSDGTVTLTFQEGLFSGAPPDAALFARSTPHRTFGPSTARPSVEEALLSTVGEQALLGLHAPLVTYVDLRELLRLRPDGAYLRARAEALGLSRALHGATLLAEHFFPEVAAEADALRPPLGAAERLAVERVVEAARDPARLRHVRGADAAARLVVAP